MPKLDTPPIQSCPALCSRALKPSAQHVMQPCPLQGRLQRRNWRIGAGYLYRGRLFSRAPSALFDCVNEMGLCVLLRPPAEYVNLDDCWMSTERDASGNLQWDPVAFPTGHTLGDYVHSKGFKFGMWVLAPSLPSAVASCSVLRSSLRGVLPVPALVQSVASSAVPPCLCGSASALARPLPTAAALPRCCSVSSSQVSLS